KIMPIDVIDLPLNQQRYALFTSAGGGILDDLMVTRRGDDYLLVVNAGCKHEDVAHLRAQLPASIGVEPLFDRALLALQGPLARAVLTRLAPAAAGLKFMQAASLDVAGIECWVSCSGYTGEDGYEIACAGDSAETLATLLLAQREVAPIGLGARDSLRLEAGLCLYGHDIDQNTTPVTANLQWALAKIRRPGGARAGNYLGSSVIEAQLRDGVERQRVLLRPEGKQPVREGAEIVDNADAVVGRISSGGFGPALGTPVAMGYVDSAALAEPLFALVRNKRIALQIQRGPFVPHRYCR